MKYHRVCLEALGYTLPDEIVTSADLEARLGPLYRRLRLPQGRLELMTGIRERRFWAPGTLPSDKSILSGQMALQAVDFDRNHIGALIHGSVCRDHLEPATACRVHHGLDLPRACAVYDVSNACLGVLNGVVQVANMIELGQIRAGLVVGTESSRPLVETTIEWLNRNELLTRDQVKPAFASLTIGSGSVAVLLVDRELSRTGNRLLAAEMFADSRFHQLCHSGRDEAIASGMRPLMQTDSEQLLRAGVATGAAAFRHFLDKLGWDVADIDRTFCHQVGAAHRKLLLETLNLNQEVDYATVEWLGNTGSAALPLTMALGVEDGRLQKNDRVAMLGIGSGINAVLLAVSWQNCPSGRGSKPARIVLQQA